MTTVGVRLRLELGGNLGYVFLFSKSKIFHLLTQIYFEIIKLIHEFILHKTPHNAHGGGLGYGCQQKMGK
jgi:hypothetical protein